MRNRFYSPRHQPGDKSKLGARSQSPLRLGSPESVRDPTLEPFLQEERIGAYAYDVGRAVGRGFSSVVYRAVHMRTRKPAAVKVVNFREFSPSSMKMLENEIKVLRSLDHPNIVRCLDVYRTPSHFYIVTEYCQGDLAAFMRQQGPLPQLAALHVVSQVAAGVKYLFSKGILHRDLKPANILRGEQHWKIADFGFALFTTGQFRSRYKVGTPLYMPPEALLGSVYSPQSDIFSLGIILYQLLVGRTPWECRQEKNLIRKMQREPYQVPPEVHLQTALANALQSMCAVSIDQRMTKDDFLALDLMAPELQIRTQPTNNSTEGEYHSPNKDHSKNKDHSPNQEDPPNISSPKQQMTNSSPAKNHATGTFQRAEGQQKAAVSGRKCQVEGVDRIESRNNNLLVSQLHFCRFMYYLVRNMEHLRVSSRGRVKLSLLLYSHIGKLMDQLSSDSRNHFGLPQWPTFVRSPRFLKTNQTIKEYRARYSQEQSHYLSSVEPDAVVQLNATCPNFTQQDYFSPQGYAEALLLTAALLREANHNQAVELRKAQEPLSAETKAGIEALNALFRYHQMLSLSQKQLGEFQVLQKESVIRVQIDFLSSVASLSDYHALRQNLKSL